MNSKSGSSVRPHKVVGIIGVISTGKIANRAVVINAVDYPTPGDAPPRQP